MMLLMVVSNGDFIYYEKQIIDSDEMPLRKSVCIAVFAGVSYRQVPGLHI